MKCVLLAVLLIAVATAEVSTVQVRYNNNTKKFSTTGGDAFGPIAATVFTNFSFYENGWDVMTATGNSTFMKDSEEHRLLGYKAAGFGEGFLNHVRIWQNFQNTFDGPNGLYPMLLQSPEIVPWIERHQAYLVQRSTQGDNIGKMLGGLLALIEGLSEGYLAANTNAAESINATQMFWLSFQAEVGDIITAYSSTEEVEMWRQFPNLDPRRPARHCSALVKVLKEDVYFSHDTWSSFNSMMRQYKTYSFEDKVVSMSGYPGVIHSIDDWYMTQSRLAVQETTNGVYNTSLFIEFVKPGTDTISEFLRVMIANFLAEDSPSWVNYFSTENSGTYNNQWMVFDMKKFTPNVTTLPSDTFWVAEQLPGSTYPYGVTSQDKTAHLNEHGYWASYNLPYFTNVYDVSENLQQYEATGDFFSYTNYSRALIFHRNQSDVVDLDSMKAMMRYNNYQHDPFSLIDNCTTATNGVCQPPYSAMLTIASRGDLNPPGGESHYGPNYNFLTQRDHCATDTKIAVWSKMMSQSLEMAGVVINGPTRYQQPTFQWSTSPFANNANIIRNGLPDVYDFDFQEFSSAFPPVPAGAPASSGSSGLSEAAKLGLGIGLGVGGAVIVIVALVCLMKGKKSSVDKEEQVNLV